MVASRPVASSSQAAYVLLQSGGRKFHRDRAHAERREAEEHAITVEQLFHNGDRSAPGPQTQSLTISAYIHAQLLWTPVVDAHVDASVTMKTTRQVAIPLKVYGRRVLQTPNVELHLSDRTILPALDGLGCEHGHVDILGVFERRFPFLYSPSTAGLRWFRSGIFDRGWAFFTFFSLGKGLVKAFEPFSVIRNSQTRLRVFCGGAGDLWKQQQGNCKQAHLEYPVKSSGLNTNPILASCLHSGVA